MRIAAIAGALAIAACQSKTKAPPAPAPAPGDASSDETCKRAAHDQIMRSDRDISNALAAQKLVLFAPQFLPTPFDEAPRGTMPDPAEAKRHEEAVAPFADKHTGDTVTWKNGADTVTGIFIEPADAGWIIARRGNEIVLAKPARWRPLTCVDTTAYSGGCTDAGPKPLLFALPPGTKLGGTLELDAERVTLKLTGGPPVPCPP